MPAWIPCAYDVGCDVRDAAHNGGKASLIVSLNVIAPAEKGAPVRPTSGSVTLVCTTQCALESDDMFTTAVPEQAQ
jgi:hypothetical protein